MQGKYALNWLFDWLGLGSMGSDYQLLESVQPVLAIDPFQYPLFRPNYRNIGFAINNPFSVVNLPDPVNSDGTRNTKLCRIWLELGLVKNVVNVNDRTELVRLTTSGDVFEIATWTEDLVGAAFQLPIIGNIRYSSPGGGATRAVFNGHKPVYVPAEETLFLRMAVPVNTSGSLVGRFVDVNASAPVPFDCLW